MSTVLIVIIVVVALVVVAALVSAASRRKRTEQLARTQVQAKHDDVDHHREQAHDARAEAQLAEERAKRAAAEAELNERKADERERDLGSRDPLSHLVGLTRPAAVPASTGAEIKRSEDEVPET